MIIAIFAMFFLFGISTIVFSLAFGEKGRTSGQITKQKATEAAYSGLDQAVQAIVDDPSAPDAFGVDADTGISDGSCTSADPGDSHWTELNDTGTTEWRLNQEAAYCYTVKCPEGTSSTTPCESTERIIRALGRARSYRKSKTGLTPTTAYAYQTATVRVKILR